MTNLPTPAQAEAGNYKKDHISVQGLSIAIENKKGTHRRPEWKPLAADYGYIKRTKGADGDHVDVFVGTHRDSPIVFVIDQVSQSGRFDEHKALIGFRTQAEAVEAYRGCYPSGWKVGTVTAMTIQQFKNWLSSGNQMKSIASQVSQYAAQWSEEKHPRANDGKFSNGPGQPGQSGGQQITDLWDDSQTPSPGSHAGNKSRHGIRDDARHANLKRSIGDEIMERIKQHEENEQGDDAGRPTGLDPHDHRNLPEGIREALMDWHFEAEEAFKRVGWEKLGAEHAGTDPRAAKQSAYKRIGRDNVKNLAGSLSAIIRDAMDSQGVDLKPFIKHGNLIPRDMAAKMKPNDKLFRPTTDEERYAAAMQALVEQYAGKGPRNSPGQMSLFDGEELRTGKTQRKINWEQEKHKHPRAADGKFTSGPDQTGGPKPEKPKDVLDVSEEEKQKRRDFWAKAGEQQEQKSEGEKEEFFKGEKIRLTGGKAEPGFEEFEYLEGHKKGQKGFRATAETRDSQAEKSKKDWQDQQDQFRRLKQRKAADDGPKDKPAGIQMPELKNQDAKSGDQLGLIDGAGKRNPGKAFKAKELGQEKQNALFNKSGAPGQMDMFGGDGTPDDLVYKPKADKKTETPSPGSPKQEDGPKDGDRNAEGLVFRNGRWHRDDEGDTETPPPPKAPKGSEPETPRQEAAAETDAMTDSEYAFARSSKVQNAGEDLLGSARHQRNAWRTLEEAEENGSAEKLVTRANLLKNEPTEFTSIAQDSDAGPMAAFMMAAATRAFPPKPNYPRGASAEDKKKVRRQYLEAFRDTVDKAHEIARGSSTDPREMTRELSRFVAGRIDKLRREDDKYNYTANGLVNYANNLGRSYSGSSIVRKAGEVALAIGSQHETSDAKRQAMIDAVEKLEAGKSLASLSGKSKDSKPEKFKPANLYVGIAERKGGPKVPVKSAKQATDYLVDKIGIRGVQFGNSVTDSEREHHATKAAEALVDLADVTGLPLDAISMKGKLGLAMGARGRAGAVAHYEPDNKVINLTRKNGVGSLAHEWAHALDHEMGGGTVEKYFNGSVSSFFSEDHGVSRVGKRVDGKFETEVIDKRDQPLFKAIEGVRKAFESSGFESRLNEELRDAVRSKRISRNGKTGVAYWRSNLEKFARCFERYVQVELESKDRKNTYLAGVETKSYKEGGFWPTNEEVKKMKPAIDKLLDTYRTESLGVKDRATYSAADRQRMVHDLIIEHYEAVSAAGKAAKAGRKIVRGEEGDTGYFVTIDDQPVFIEVKGAKAGTVIRGPKSARGKHVKSVKGKRSARVRPSKKTGAKNSPGQLHTDGDVIRSAKTNQPLPGTYWDPKEQPSDRIVPKTEFDKWIVEEVGDKKDDVEYFRELVTDAHKMLSTEHEESNQDLRELLSHFGYTGKRTGQIITAARRAGDGNAISRFDEMVDMAANNYPQLLQHSSGAWSGRGDNEQALLNRLQDGFKKAPTRTSDEVFDLAKSMFTSPGKPTDFDDEFDPEWDLTPEQKEDLDSVPFAAALNDLITERYRAGALSLAAQRPPASRVLSRDSQSLRETPLSLATRMDSESDRYPFMEQDLITRALSTGEHCYN